LRCRLAAASKRIIDPMATHACREQTPVDNRRLLEIDD
jgi:hypothetical protein